MPYRYLDDEATGDAAFEAWGKDLDEVFSSAGEALTGVMIGNPESIRPSDKREMTLSDDRLDLLLLNFLEQLVHYKDTSKFLASRTEVRITKTGEAWTLGASAMGEVLDAERHQQVVDVKAVTLHNFSLVQQDGRWRAHVVLDI
jgi:SHS2 domain-containing protein